jgi:hypothetical protein
MRGTEWRLPFGANLVEPEQTRFQICAPGQRKLSLIIEGREPLVMTAGDAGWFDVAVGCGAGQGENSTFADPDEQVNIFGQRGEAQPFGSNGPVQVRHPTGSANSIQSLSEQQPDFTAGPPYSSEQLKSVSRQPW